MLSPSLGHPRLGPRSTYRTSGQEVGSPAASSNPGDSARSSNPTASGGSAAYTSPAREIPLESTGRECSAQCRQRSVGFSPLPVTLHPG
jgi:hypothetical protein